MSTVFWCALQNDAEDDCPDDLGYLYDHVEELDKLCVAAGRKTLSSFLDDSDLQFNLSDEDLGDDWLAEHARWFEPDNLLSSVEALLELAETLDAGAVEELSYVRDRCLSAGKAGTKVRLLVVM